MHPQRCTPPPRRPTIGIRRAAVLLLALAPAAACDSVTEPPPLSELRIGHAATSTGPFEVALGGVVLADALALGESVVDSVSDGDHAIIFSAEGSTVATGVRTFGPLIGVVLLMDGTSPDLHSYPHTGSGGGALIKTINADPNRSLTVELDGDGSSLSATMDPTEAVDFSVTGGTFQVTLSEAGTAQAVDLGSVELRAGRSFVVVYPSPNDAVPWQLLIF